MCNKKELLTPTRFGTGSTDFAPWWCCGRYTRGVTRSWMLLVSYVGISTYGTIIAKSTPITALTLLNQCNALGCDNASDDYYYAQ